MPTSISEIRIASYHELLDHIDSEYFSCRYGEWIFRGHSSRRHILKPSVGRVNYTETSFSKFENSIFAYFKRTAIQHMPKEPDNDFEWLSVAQHHGLPTRLLDWSNNPLIALFFAIKSNPTEDAVLYAMHADKRIHDDILEENQPFKIVKDYKYVPRILANRVSSQEGVFTIHCNPQSSLEENLREGWELERVIIPSNLKSDLQYMLFRKGVHHGKLFPDLDGLASHLKWQHTVLPSSKLPE